MILSPTVRRTQGVRRPWLLPHWTNVFRNGPPTRDEETRNTWMTAEERRFILWGFKEGWSATRIGRELGVNEATIRRFRAAIKKKPETLLELGL